jgi:transcriptional regulator with PAS, ATPase and Fis domain
VAKALHDASQRKEKPFVALDCSSIPETLIESELFGHEKGSFTDAKESRQGIFEVAQDGTLFLDEIESLSLVVQAKLLRVLQERTFRRIGGRSDLNFAARIVSATNENLEKLVEAGKFRRDLFYRFAVLPIEIPPLRERREDLPELVSFLLRNRQSSQKITPEAMNVLINYEWQGNVRELENVISYISALGDETIKPEDLPLKVSTIDATKTDFQTLAKLEKQHILQVFESTNRNRVKTANILGIDRRTLFNKLKQFGISENE